MRILHTPEAASETGGLAPESPVPPPVAAPAAATVNSAEAASVALAARVAELEAALAAEKDSHAKTAAERKARELRISELEDALRAARDPQPVPDKQRRQEKAAGNALTEWLTGTGRFAAEED